MPFLTEISDFRRQVKVQAGVPPARQNSSLAASAAGFFQILRKFWKNTVTFWGVLRL
jgi:hypothetical protein